MNLIIMKYLPVFLLAFTLSWRSWAQEYLRKKHFNLETSNVAISGYDPVSYYAGKAPKEGEEKWAWDYAGVTYLFSSPDNLEMFKSQPEDYEPQYGGWCSYAMGETGEKVEVDPETFKLIDGKLYLFYNFYFTNTLKKWNKDQDRLMPSADSKWAAIFR